MACDRARTGDPRLSIAERFTSREVYLARYTQALDALIKQHWILAEDRAAMIQRGDEEWDLATR